MRIERVRNRDIVVSHVGSFEWCPPRSRLDPGAAGEVAVLRPDLAGGHPPAVATADYEQRLATWREWEQVSIAAQGNGSAR